MLIIREKILILAEGPTQGLDDTTLTAEAKDHINFTQSRKKFVLSLHNNGSSTLLFAHAKKVYQVKAKNSEIKDYALCLGNVSKDFTIDNMKKETKTKQNKRKCKFVSVASNTGWEFRRFMLAFYYIFF